MLKPTHSFLAPMLGIRRLAVTLVPQSLRERRPRELCRGCVRVPDRAKLEQLACDASGWGRSFFSKAETIAWCARIYG